jgi:zinc protease
MRFPWRNRAQTHCPEGFISRVELGLPLQEPSLAAQHYLALTAEQLKAAFAKRLRPEDLVRVTEGPKPF